MSRSSGHRRRRRQRGLSAPSNYSCQRRGRREHSGRLAFGKFGGDREYVAVADVFGITIATMNDAQRATRSDREQLFVAVPSASHASLGEGRNETVAATLRLCLQSMQELRIAIFFQSQQHWHALVPTDRTERLLYRALPHSALGDWSEGGRAVLQQKIQAYDAAGGYDVAPSFVRRSGEKR